MVWGMGAGNPVKSLGQFSSSSTCIHIQTLNPTKTWHLNPCNNSHSKSSLLEQDYIWTQSILYYWRPKQSTAALCLTEGNSYVFAETQSTLVTFLEFVFESVSEALALSNGKTGASPKGKQWLTLCIAEMESACQHLVFSNFNLTSLLLAPCKQVPGHTTLYKGNFTLYNHKVPSCDSVTSKEGHAPTLFHLPTDGCWQWCHGGKIEITICINQNPCKPRASSLQWTCIFTCSNSYATYTYDS